MTTGRIFLALGGIACRGRARRFGARAEGPPAGRDARRVAHRRRVSLHHALGLLAVGLVAAQLPDSTLLRWSGWLMLAGIVLFSGTLYAFALSGERWLGAITPVGGVAFLGAWALFVIAVLKI
jgi:uncharacterized membrane protein YgdD (TMEM256/DUF423 family)